LRAIVDKVKGAIKDKKIDSPGKVFSLEVTTPLLIVLDPPPLYL
jgi:hypothetical protein